MVGVPIKASSIYGKPTFQFLSGQFELNEIRKEPHKDRAKKIIDAFEPKHGKQFQDFVKHMVANGIYPVVRQNEDGRIYGLTFIDNETKCVFNGSKLGKGYSAKGIQDRFQVDPNSKGAPIPRLPAKEYRDESTHQVKSQGTGISSDLLQKLTEADVDHSNTPYELKRKKKRRGRSI